MKTKILIMAILISVSNISAQWIHVITSIYDINDIYVLKKNDVFVLAENASIYHTLDDGLSWEVTYPDFGDLLDISFADSNNGWAVGIWDIVHTSNGGLTWELQGSVSGLWEGVSFADSINGIIVGQQGKIMWTNNGGITWTDRSLTPSIFYNFRDVHCFDSLTATIVGGTYEYGIIKTTNAGETWTQQSNMSGLTALSFIDSDYGFAVGYGGKVLKTTNGGLWWTMQNIGTAGDYLNDICFTDRNNGTIVAQAGTTFKTTDGGENWIRYQSGSSAFLTSVSFIDENYGWASGLNTILRTTNGGVTFIETENNIIPPKEYLLQQNYPNPFNPSTKISWQSPVGGWQTLKVYDVLGNEVATLVNEYRPAGSYEVEFKSTVGSHQLANGVYLYRLQAGDPSTSSGQSFIEIKKAILLK